MVKGLSTKIDIKASSIKIVNMFFFADDADTENLAAACGTLYKLAPHHCWNCRRYSVHQVTFNYFSKLWLFPEHQYSQRRVTHTKNSSLLFLFRLLHSGRGEQSVENCQSRKVFLVKREREEKTWHNVTVSLFKHFPRTNIGISVIFNSVSDRKMNYFRYNERCQQWSGYSSQSSETWVAVGEQSVCYSVVGYIDGRHCNPCWQHAEGKLLKTCFEPLNIPSEKN